MKQKIIRIMVLSSVLGLCASQTALADSVAKSITSSATGVALDTLKGIGEGIDEHFTSKFELDPASDFKSLGIEITNIKDKEPGTNRITAYVISTTKPYTGKIRIKAFNKDNKEIGRANADVVLEEDDAKDIIFQFGEQMDSFLVTKYVISAK